MEDSEMILRRLDSMDSRLGGIDTRLALIDDELESAKGRAGVHDRAIFGGPTGDGKRVVGLYEKLEDVQTSATAAATAATRASEGVATMSRTWAEFPRRVFKFGMRGLYVGIVAFASCVIFVFHNWDKIVNTIEYWRH